MVVPTTVVFTLIDFVNEKNSSIYDFFEIHCDSLLLKQAIPTKILNIVKIISMYIKTKGEEQYIKMSLETPLFSCSFWLNVNIIRF